MDCYSCSYYKEWYMENECELTGFCNFRPQENCDLVNDNGEVNEIKLKEICEGI